MAAKAVPGAFVKVYRFRSGREETPGLSCLSCPSTPCVGRLRVAPDGVVSLLAIPPPVLNEFGNVLHLQFPAVVVHQLVCARMPALRSAQDQNPPASSLAGALRLNAYVLALGVPLPFAMCGRRLCPALKRQRLLAHRAPSLGVEAGVAKKPRAVVAGWVNKYPTPARENLLCSVVEGVNHLLFRGEKPKSASVDSVRHQRPL